MPSNNGKYYVRKKDSNKVKSKKITSLFSSVSVPNTSRDNSDESTSFVDSPVYTVFIYLVL